MRSHNTLGQLSDLPLRHRAYESSASIMRGGAKYCGFAFRNQGLRFFVEVVVLVVLRALQGYLEGETVLGNLINPYAWGKLFRP